MTYRRKTTRAPRAKRAKSPTSGTEKRIEAVAVIQRQYFEGKLPSTELVAKNEPITVACFLTEPAKVSVGMGLTLNLGNYESARIDVSLVMPCYREEAEAAYTFARNWVEERLTAEVKDIRANKPGLF